MRYEIVHSTTYTYEADVSLSQHIARLKPRSSARQKILEYELTTDPAASSIVGREDYFGNHADFISVERPHRVFEVRSRSLLDVVPAVLPNPGDTLPWESVRDRSQSEDASEFAFPSSLIPQLAGLEDYATVSFPPNRPVLEGVTDLTRRIDEDFTFDPKATTVATPLETVMKNRRGVCQDFAHFQIGCLRAIGLPARYVSGYLETKPAPGATKLVGADASHAWVQVYVPEYGWIDVDPTNNVFPSDRHILVACGRDFVDVSPIRGVIVGAGKHTLAVSVDVIPVESF